MHKCQIIGISGGSGSGKTVVALLLKKHFGELAAVISQDSYYKDLSHLAERERSRINFDHPDSIDFKLLLNNLQILKDGFSVEGPEYCFKTHTRKSIRINLVPRPIIILEGIYSFFEKEIIDLLDITVYVDADSDIRLIRRIRRDVVERGRDVDSVISQYESNVRKMHEKYVSRQKKSADFIIENNGSKKLDEIVNTLVNEMKI